MHARLSDKLSQAQSSPACEFFFELSVLSDLVPLGDSISMKKTQFFFEILPGIRVVQVTTLFRVRMAPEIVRGRGRETI